MGLAYRPDVDGLRTIAVGSVIIHHAGFALHGGFLGVDIFFVISGFLITGILLRDLQADRFTLRDFYERRIRRILPALVFVALCTLPFAWWLMPPEQFGHFGKSLVALLFFVSNILFWREAGYFEPDAAEIPMIHTWSLAVEEQFYVFFPLALLMIWRLRPGLLPAVIGLVGLASLVLAEVAVRTMPSAAFYLLPFRAWELLAGSFAALLVNRWAMTGPDGQSYAGLETVPARWNNILSAAGALAILASLVLFQPTSGAPGYKVVPLVAGTVLVLLFTTSGTWVHRLLSLRWMVGIGLISYSAYLWHQPLFAFVRIAHFDPPSPLLMLGLIGLTLLLAGMSWRFVEEPFRRRVPTRAVIVSSFAGLVLLAGFGLTAYLTGGLTQQRFTGAQAQWFGSLDFSPRRAACHAQPDRLPPPEEACVYGADTPPSWAVLGDSHGVEIASALADRLAMQGDSLVHFTASACPPAYGFDSERPGCSDWTRRTVDWLVDQPDIDTVVLTYRHVVHVFPDAADLVQPSLTGRPKIANEGTSEDLRALYWASFSGMVARLAAAGKRVIILEPVPEIRRHINKYINFGSIRDGRLITLERLRHDELMSGVMSRLDEIEADRLSPEAVFCDATFCYGAGPEGAYYFDNNHLSLGGARKLVESLF